MKMTERGLLPSFLFTGAYARTRLGENIIYCSAFEKRRLFKLFRSYWKMKFFSLSVAKKYQMSEFVHKLNLFGNKCKKPLVKMHKKRYHDL